MTATALLVFARCAGFVFRAPGFSHPSVPSAVRAAFALLLAAALTPAVQPARHVDGILLAASAASDFAVGAAIGIGASILYDGAYAGGRALDDYVGIRGSMPNVQIFAASAFGRIWSMVFTAGYFLLGGYRVALYAFAQSFRSVPPGVLPASRDVYEFAAALPLSIVEAALLVAAPAIALAFVVQVTLAALSRVIPRFATFTLSFPLVFGTAVCATLLSIPIVFDRSAAPWLQIPFLPAH